MNCSVRSTSPTSSFTFEFARLRMRRSFDIGVLSSRSVWSPIFTFLMFGMSMPATSRTSSLTSMRPSTTSLKYAGVSTTTWLENWRSNSMIRIISAAPIWSANAGSSGAGSTNRPDASCRTSRLWSSDASSRSSEPTASTIVCCGASLSITAMSPNWRSASTSTTGRSLRRASTTARLAAITDLPAPPLVENTVMTRASSPVGSTPRGVGAGGWWSASRRCDARTPPSWAVSTGAGSTSRTPARRARRNSSVVSSLVTRMAPTSGCSDDRRSASASAASVAHDGPRTTATGVPLSRSLSAVSDGSGTARSPSCMARRLRTAWSASTTAIARPTGRNWGRCPGDPLLGWGRRRGRRQDTPSRRQLRRGGAGQQPCGKAPQPSSGRAAPRTHRRRAAWRPRRRG